MSEIVECPRCAMKFTAEGRSSEAECPSCGLRVVPERSGESTALVRKYFQDLGAILLHPVLFFRRMPVRGGLAGPLAFALVTHWLGSALGFLWSGFQAGRTGLLETLFRYAPDWSNEVDHSGRRMTLDRFREQAQAWMSGAGSVVADPFLTLFSILVTSAFVFVGARILVPQQDGMGRPGVTYETAVRIIAFGMTPSILLGVPFLGGVVATLAIMVYSVIGAREVYRIGTGRAIIVALFPKFLVLGAVLVIMALVLFLLGKLFLSFA